jgi:hypothetical protein
MSYEVGSADLLFYFTDKEIKESRSHCELSGRAKKESWDFTLLIWSCPALSKVTKIHCTPNSLDVSSKGQDNTCFKYSLTQKRDN